MAEKTGPKDRGIGVLGVIWSLAGISALLAASVFIRKELRSDRVQFTTSYQMVLLSNGAVY